MENVFESLQQYNDWKFFSLLEKEEKEDKKKQDKQEEPSGKEKAAVEARENGERINKKLGEDFKDLLKTFGPVSEKPTLDKIKTFCLAAEKKAEELNSSFLKSGGKFSIPFEMKSVMGKAKKAPLVYPLTGGKFVAFICDDQSGKRNLCIRGEKIKDIISDDKKTILDFVSFLRNVYKQFGVMLYDYHKINQKKNLDSFLKEKKNKPEQPKEEQKKKPEEKEKIEESLIKRNRLNEAVEIPAEEIGDVMDYEVTQIPDVDPFNNVYKLEKNGNIVAYALVDPNSVVKYYDEIPEFPSMDEYKGRIDNLNKAWELAKKEKNIEESFDGIYKNGKKIIKDVYSELNPVLKYKKVQAKHEKLKKEVEELKKEVEKRKRELEKLEKK